MFILFYLYSNLVPSLRFTLLYSNSNLIPSVLSSHLRYTVNKEKPRPFCSSSPGCCKSLTSNSSPRPHKRQFFRSSEWESDMWKPWICEDPTEFTVKFPQWRRNVNRERPSGSGHSESQMEQISHYPCPPSRHFPLAKRYPCPVWRPPQLPHTSAAQRLAVENTSDTSSSIHRDFINKRFSNEDIGDAWPETKQLFKVSNQLVLWEHKWSEISFVSLVKGMTKTKLTKVESFLRSPKRSQTSKRKITTSVHSKIHLFDFLILRLHLDMQKKPYIAVNSLSTPESGDTHGHSWALFVLPFPQEVHTLLVAIEH